MRKLFIILSLGFFCASYAQINDPVVMKVNGKDVKKSEFEYLYKKNNTGIALEEYLELFKNFKLKVAEAETQGIDTTAAFVKELEDNRNQLAKQYIKELAIDSALIRKYYDRSNEDVEISHIAIPIKLETITVAEGSENKTIASELLPADTLVAYNKAMQIRKRLLKGEKITKIAEELEKSFKMPNTPPTYMGWLPAMMMSPSLEDAIHHTTLGSVSMPVRFQTLYLLFQVHKRRPAQGEINASHIMVACSQGVDTIQVEDAQKKADEIYKRVEAGEDFATLAKELSDDKGSGQQGGELGWFGAGRMVKEFEETAFALQQKGDISKPIRSQFGFHIIKLNDRRSIEPFDQKKSQIISFLSRGGKDYDLKKPGIDNLKDKSNYNLNQPVFSKLMSLAGDHYVVDSVFLEKAKADDQVLFSIWGKEYKTAGFIEYMERTRAPYVLSTDILTDRYNAYLLEALRSEENARLEEEYMEFRNLMREYHDGFLSYEVTQKEVWERAPKDTLGLTAFFNQHRDEYVWGKPKYKGYVVLCKDNKTQKEASKKTKKMRSDSAAKFILNEFNTDSIKCVKIERGLFEQGDNPYIDEAIFKVGKAEVNKDYPEFFLIGKLLNNGPESYTDVGGLVISDYQNYLEQEWIKKLREQYPIVVYPEVLKTIE